MYTVSILFFAVMLDQFVGEPVKWHPLVAFGNCANWVEKKLRSPAMSRVQGRYLGGFALLILLLMVISVFLFFSTVVSWIAGGHLLLSIVIVYGCIASRSLKEHALAIAQPLRDGNIALARQHLQLIVSRDVNHADDKAIAAATCESVLENGSDGIFSALFWFAVAGVPGVLMYRVVNTLDAMWGYRNEKYQHFGWAAAKLDDGLNWMPARLVALSYALMGNFSGAMCCWKNQAARWSSPNAGPVMAAGAGSLQICLGGDAYYRGELFQRPLLGEGTGATVDDIDRALALIDRTLVLWLVVAVVIAVY